MDEALSQISAGECRKKINTELSLEQQTFRSVIFGLSSTEDAGEGEIRYDTDGRAWYKSGTDEWRTAATVEEDESDTKTNEKMTEDSRTPPRKGLLETRRMTTSELIPYIGQSMRAMQCHTELICSIARQSIGQTDFLPQEITAQALGCISEEVTTFTSCHLAAEENTFISEKADILTYCDRIAEAMVEQEMGIMELVVEYDAAHRTMLQLAGNFDLFLQEFRSPLLSSLRQMVNLVGSLNRIPCFLSSCDASPPRPPPAPPPEE